MRIKVSLKNLGGAIAGMYQVAKDMGKEVVALTFDVKFGDVILYIRRTPPNKGVKQAMYSDKAKTQLIPKATWIANYVKQLEAKGYKAVDATASANAAYDLGMIGISSKGIKGNAIVSVNGSEMPTTRKNAMMMATHAGVVVVESDIISRKQVAVSMGAFEAAIKPKFEESVKAT